MRETTELQRHEKDSAAVDGNFLRILFHTPGLEIKRVKKKGENFHFSGIRPAEAIFSSAKNALSVHIYMMYIMYIICILCRGAEAQKMRCR